MDKYILMRFSKKTGKIDTTLESLMSSMLEMWALQKTTKTKDTVIFNKDTGEIVFYVEGTENAFPHVVKDHVGNIEDLCPGLLRAVND